MKTIIISIDDIHAKQPQIVSMIMPEDQTEKGLDAWLEAYETVYPYSYKVKFDNQYQELIDEILHKNYEENLLDFTSGVCD